MTITATNPLDELRHAARTIHNATTSTQPANPTEILAAHNILARHRHHTTGTARAAIDHYLDHTTWQHGPLHLQAAIHQLADALNATTPDNGVQLHLF